MPHPLIALTAAAAAFVLLAPPAGADDLAGTAWRAVAAEGERLPAGPEATMVFGGGGEIGGSTGCNRYFGSYRRSGSALAFGPATATRMACPHPAGTVEAAFLRALEATERFDREDGRLVLLDRRGTRVLVLERMPGAG